MPRTKIREDSHGPYVRTGGYLFRPVPARWSNPPWDLDKTKHRVGEEVNARHMSQTTHALVNDEIWHGHGTYLNKASTEECWDTKDTGDA